MTRRQRALALALILAAVLVRAVAPGPAAAQEAVPVRGGQHDGFGRIVFDWQDPVQYRATIRNGQLNLAFERQASFMTGGLFPALDSYIGAPAPGPHGYRISFPLKGEVGLKDFTYGPKVVIDLKRADAGQSAGSPLPQVPVRAGRHDAYDRLVFDWPERVGYRIAPPDAGQAAVVFDSPAELQLDDYRETALDRVRALTPLPSEDGLRAELEVPPGAALRHFRLDNRVVVDVFDPGTTPPQIASANSKTVGGSGAGDAGGTADKDAPAPSADSKEADTAATPADPESAADSADGGDAGADDSTAAETGTSDSEPPARDSPKKSPQTPGAPTPLIPEAGGESVSAPDGGQRPSQTAEATAGAGAGAGTGGGAPPAPDDAGGDADARAQLAALTERPALDGSIRLSPEQVAAGNVPKPGEMARVQAPVRLPLPWAGERAAVLRRGDRLLLVAEGAPPTTFPRQIINAVSGVDEVVQNLVGGSAVVEIRTGPRLNATLDRNDGNWVLSLVPRVTLPLRPFRPTVRDGRIVVPVESPGEVVRFEDPGSGGELAVVPVGETGRGVAMAQRFQELILLATTQGVAVAPLSDNVQVTRDSEGVVIRGAQRPLIVSKTDLNRSASGGKVQVAEGDRLLDLIAWRRPDKPYDQARQTLQKAVAEAPANKQHLARLDLGRFYFAHGMATEALGALELYSRDAPRRRRDPQILLMMGAAQLLNGDWVEAAETLAHPARDGVAEALPWRAAQSILGGNDEAGVASFERAAHLLAPYPPFVQRKLHLWAAGAYLRLGNVPKAATELKQVRDLSPTPSEQAEIAFLQARIHLLNEEPEKAETLWNEVARGDNPSARTRARFVLLERALADQSQDRAAAIEELERLRFAWRGDAFEAVLLHRLADLYLAEKNYRKALTTLRQAASNLPGTTRAKLAAQRMREIFQRLFLDGAADSLPPIEALALYESFRELTPAGDKGNRMIGKLADRLVQVDLLERAAALLDGQVRHRLGGTAKARAGTRLASIRLLDRTPEKAIEALNITEVGSMPEELRRQRQHLRARALHRIGRTAEAVAVVAADDSPEVRRILAKIHADSGNWAAAVDVLGALLPPVPDAPADLAKADRQKVLRYVVAATLAGDRAAIERARSRYGAAMSAGPSGESFRMLTASDGSGLNDVSTQLAQVQQAEAFVEGFLNSLRQQASLDGAADATD